MDKIAVLIPCYNEEISIAKVIKDAKTHLPEATIYVYDNNSTDKTVEIAQKEGAIVRHVYQQGKGNVIRVMFKEVDALCYIMVDGDDTYELSSAPKMVDLVLNHNSDMVVGDRLSSTYFTENKRLFHNFGNSLVRFATNHIFKSDIRDVMTGYRAFSYQFVKSFSVLSTGFEIETEMTIHSIDKRMQVDNLIIEYRDRPEGSFSKLNTIKDGIRVINTIIKLTRSYKPMLYFGILAILSFIIGIALFIPGAISFSSNSFVRSDYIYLFISSLFLILSFMLILSGLILKTLRHGERQEFEHNLIRVNDEFKNKIESNKKRD